MTLKIQEIQSMADAIQYVLENIEDASDRNLERLKFVAWCELMNRGMEDNYYE